MTNEHDRINTALSLAGEVLTERSGEISTHYDGCYVWHANCLARRIEAILTRGPGSAD